MRYTPYFSIHPPTQARYRTNVDAAELFVANFARLRQECKFRATKGPETGSRRRRWTRCLCARQGTLPAKEGGRAFLAHLAGVNVLFFAACLSVKAVDFKF